MILQSNASEVNGNASRFTSIETPTVYHGNDCLPSWLDNFIIVLYILIFVTALLSNVAICYVIVCKKSMHTTTNYYLFNLSMSDLMLLIFGITSQIETLVSPAKFFSSSYNCFITYTVIDTSANVSIMTITSFTIERYLAICHPFLAHVMSRTSRVIKLLIVIWIVSILSNMPVVWQYSLVTSRGITKCSLNKKAISHGLEISMMVVFFIVPMVVMIILHVLIGMQLSKMTGSNEKRINATQTYLQMTKSIKKTSRILVVIAMTFCVCWAPLRITRLLTNYLNSADYTKVPDSVVTIHCVLNHLSSILVLLSTIMNPLIFSIMSSKFRNAFKDLSQETYQKVRTTKVSNSVSNNVNK